MRFISQDFHKFLQPPALIYTTFDHASTKQQFSTTMQCFSFRLTNQIFPLHTHSTSHSVLFHVLSYHPATGTSAITDWPAVVQGPASDSAALTGSPEHHFLCLHLFGFRQGLVDFACKLCSDFCFLGTANRSDGPSSCDSIWTSHRFRFR